MIDKYFQVIMPVSPDHEVTAKQGIIISVAEAYRITPYLPRNSSNSPMFDLDKLKDRYKAAEFIVADLSFERPSCYYELGIAESLDLPIFLLAASGTHIHQTTKYQEVNYYADLATYRQLFEQILKQCCS